MVSDQRFWLVWSPTGVYPPKFRHATVESANREACRLAQTRSGVEFFVLEAVNRARSLEVELVELKTGDEIPF